MRTTIPDAEVYEWEYRGPYYVRVDLGSVEIDAYKVKQSGRIEEIVISTLGKIQHIQCDDMAKCDNIIIKGAKEGQYHTVADIVTAMNDAIEAQAAKDDEPETPSERLAQDVHPDR